MIKVFNSDDKTYETNGNVVLNPTYANVHKEDNGEYYLDLETSIEEDKIKHIEHEEGSTIETTGTTLTNVDTTKEHKFISLYGETQQDSTTGKQLIDINSNSFNTQTINGVTITNMGDGSIKLNGTVTGNEFSVRVTKNIPSEINSGIKYYLKANTLSGTSDTYSKIIFGSLNGGPTNTLINSKNEENNFTTSSNYNLIWLYIYAGTGKTFNNLIIKPILSTFKDTEWEKYTGGSPAPSPTYPFDIHNVSGDNTIEICGKNLFDKNNANILNAYIQLATGKIISSNGDKTIYIKCQPNTSYTISKAVDTTKNRFRFCSANVVPSINNIGSNVVGDANLIDNLSNYTYTTSNDAQYLLVQCWVTGGDLTEQQMLNSIQIEKGSTSSEYEAYTGNSQLISLGVENLFDKDNAPTIKLYVDNTNNVLKTSDNSFATYLEIQPNTTYTISKQVGQAFRVATTTNIPANNVSILSTTANHTGTSITITSEANAKYLYIHYFNSGNTGTADEMKATIQVEKDSKANSYSPYGASYIELNKISTYQDYIYKENDRWYLHKEIGKVVFDENSGWIYNTTSGVLVNNSSIINGKYLVQNAFCDYYKNVINEEIYNNSRAGTYLNNGEFTFRAGETKDRMFIKDTRYSTTEDFNNWLSTHNITCYYVLATPTDTEITDTTLLEQLNNFEKMKLYNGITNISITPNDLTPITKLHYNYITGGDVVINNNDYIKPNNIIVANTPTGEQAFRITDIEKRKHKIVLKAWHISYDTKNYVIQDSYVVDKTCNQAMDHLNNATDNISPFTTTSDITTINSYRCVRRSLFEAFNVVLERWGGHFVRDNWNFKIMNSIGQDNGVVVRYAKNLKDIEVDYNWDEVCTKILPVGDDGLMLDEIYLYADIQYDIPYSKVIHFAQNVDTTPYEDEDGNLDEDAYTQALKNDLRSQANNYLQEHQLPQVNYTLQANLEKITDVGDIIQVIDERLGVNITTSLISFDYDPILERYTYLEFGNFKKQLSNLTEIMATQTNEIVSEATATTRITLENELNEATSKIWGVLGSSYVLVEGDKILILDSLPKETATNVIMLNSAGIGFSNTGINGTFTSAWTIDNVLNMQNINVINLTADLIKGGTLKLGSNLNQNGILEVYDESNNLIAELNKDGLKMFATDGGYILINTTVGFAGYDRNNVKIYWADGDEFHMKKSVVEEEITLVDKMRIIPITITNNGTIVNDGIGFVSTL